MVLQISLKAKIVTKSFKQKDDVQFFLGQNLGTCIILLITDVVICDLKIHKMDVNMIFFFNGDLQEEIYQTKLKALYILDKKTRYVT